MLKQIISNPYRVLGVFSNSPKREMVANKGKIQAFLRAQRSLPFPLDLCGILPDLTRTQDLLDKADSELAIASGKMDHALFWFINKTPVDNIAFNHLFTGQIDTAMNMWQGKNNMSSLQNLFVCNLIKDNYLAAIRDCAVPLYNTYASEFVAEIDEKLTIRQQELIEKVIEALANARVNLSHISRFLTDPTWKSFLDARQINPMLEKLEACIEEAKTMSKKDAMGRLNAGKKLMIDTEGTLGFLKTLLPKGDSRFQIISDKIAQETLLCSIDYYNETSEVDAPAKALPLCEYALKVAVGDATKQRVKENMVVLQNAYSNMPPVKAAAEAKQIDALIAWYSILPLTSANGLQLVKKAQPILRQLKEKLGKSNKYYLETSSLLVSAALTGVIDEVISALKDDEPDPFAGIFRGAYDFLGADRRRKKAAHIKSILKSAWQTIVYLDLMDKTSDCEKNRYGSNRKSLHKIIQDLKGFTYDSNHLIAGCALGISAPQKFFLSDTEYFNSCSSKSEYEDYLKEFPSGKHKEKTKERIRQIMKRKRILWIVGIGIVAAFIVFIIISVKNSSSSYNSSSKLYENSSSSYYSEVDSSECDSNEYTDYEHESSYSSNSEPEPASEPTEYELYIDNYLSTGDLPYRSVYGRNKSYDDYTEHSEMRITGPSNSDVVVIVKRGSSNGKVVGHAYIHRGGTVTIKIPNGTYQPFFYYGEGWNPNKEMGNGLKGGFVSDEYVSKDDPQSLHNDILTYSLVLQSNGNFQTKGSNKNEAF